MNSDEFRTDTYIQMAAEDLLTMIAEKALDDLESANPDLRYEAYYWFASRYSDLYQVLLPKFGLQRSPADFLALVTERGMPAYPATGFEVLELDTGNPADWWGCDAQRCDPAEYARHLAGHVTGLIQLRAAAGNGCRIAITGHYKEMLQAAICTAARFERINPARVCAAAMKAAPQLALSRAPQRPYAGLAIEQRPLFAAGQAVA